MKVIVPTAIKSHAIAVTERGRWLELIDSFSFLPTDAPHYATVLAEKSCDSPEDFS
jgi:hypothetical protein